MFNHIPRTINAIGFALLSWFSFYICAWLDGWKCVAFASFGFSMFWCGIVEMSMLAWDNYGSNTMKMTPVPNLTEETVVHTQVTPYQMTIAHLPIDRNRMRIAADALLRDDFSEAKWAGNMFSGREVRSIKLEFMKRGILVYKDDRNPRIGYSTTRAGRAALEYLASPTTR